MAKDMNIWIDARKRYHLSDAQVQMARELGLNPKKFGSLANHRQEQWKLPLPEFIAEIYYKRFRKTRPDNVRSIEQMIKDQKQKKLLRKEAKILKRESQQTLSGLSPVPAEQSQPEA